MNLRDKLTALVKGIRTRYLRRGSGAPLLVLPGLLGRRADAVVGAAESTHEGYAPDPPGFWESEAPKESLTIPWMGDWASEFHRGVIGRRPLIVFAFSAGATCLIRYAATHPGAIERMVLFEPIIRGREMPSWLKAFIAASAIPGASKVIVKWAPQLVPLLPGVSRIGWRKRSRLVEGIRSPRSAGELGRSLWRWDATDELRSLDIPVLMVRGTHESLVPYHTLGSFRRPNIAHLELPGLSHFLNRAGQEQVVEAVKDFIRPRGFPGA
ncbi:MAG: alpha/beta fold hydrolase [Dehalococcoidia bacterium]